MSEYEERSKRIGADPDLRRAYLNSTIVQNGLSTYVAGQSELEPAMRQTIVALANRVEILENALMAVHEHGYTPGKAKGQ